MKHPLAKLLPKHGEKPDAQDAHIAAVAQGHGNHGADPPLIALGPGLGRIGEQENRHGVGDGRREEHKGQSHAGKHAVDGQGLGVGEAEGFQLVGDPYGFGASKDV